jgi:hypothetical protein
MRASRMREQLVQLGFCGKDPTGHERARYFSQGLIGPRYMKAGAEIDDQVEVAIGEGKPPDISQDQLGAGTVAAELTSSLIDQCWIDVESHQPGWRQMVIERGQGNPAAAAQLEDPAPAGEPQRPKHQGYLEVLLAPVARSFVREWAVLRQGERWHRGSRSPTPVAPLCALP